MKIYAVLCDSYGDVYLAKVFSTLEKAKEYIKPDTKSENEDDEEEPCTSEYFIEEMEVE